MDSFYDQNGLDMGDPEPSVRWQASQMNPLLQRLVGGGSRGGFGQRSASANDLFSHDRETTPWPQFSPEEAQDASSSSGAIPSPERPETPPSASDEGFYQDSMPFTLTALARKATRGELGQSRRSKVAGEKGKGRAQFEPSLSRKPSMMDIDDELPTLRPGKRTLTRNLSMPPPEITPDRHMKSPPTERQSGQMPKGKGSEATAARLTRKPSLIDIEMASPRSSRTGDPNSMPPPPAPDTVRNPSTRPPASATTSNDRTRTARGPMTKSLSTPNAFAEPSSASPGLASSRSRDSFANTTRSPSVSIVATLETPDAPPAKTAPVRPSQGRPGGRPPALGMRRVTAPYGSASGSQIPSTQSKYDVSSSQQLPTKRKGFKTPFINPAAKVTSPTIPPPPKGKEKTASPAFSKRSVSTGSTSSYTSNSTMFTTGSRSSSQTSNESDEQGSSKPTSHTNIKPQEVTSKDENDDDDDDLLDDPNDDSYGDLLGIDDLDDDAVFRALSGCP
ncbi:hypothetical protein BKA70DRAFT_1578888 [Coprinopsis sp. MPI-PUGE-AT-0042]|nr:hypothetical protein BKA70DRAFT_1578888 [Coprinopsis sp. MPI-PUGE-AT-0042]